MGQLVLVCRGTRGGLVYSSSSILPPHPALNDRPQNMVLPYSDHWPNINAYLRSNRLTFGRCKSRTSSIQCSLLCAVICGQLALFWFAFRSWTCKLHLCFYLCVCVLLCMCFSVCAFSLHFFGSLFELEACKLHLSFYLCVCVLLVYVL